MTTSIENHGDPVELHYLCGDSNFDTHLASGATTHFRPRSNACTLEVGPAAKRDLSVANVCSFAAGCSVSVKFTGGAGTPATVSGSGAIDVVGSTATVRP